MTQSTGSMDSPSSAHSATTADDTSPEGPKYLTRETESPPLTLGPKRVHYAYSVSLPLIHLTFVSIVQGFAVAILLQSFPLPSAVSVISVASFVSFIGAQHAYLPYVTSGLLVVLIWKQFVQASMFLLRPLSTLQIVLMLLISLAEVIAFREIAHFSAWVVGLGLVGIVGGLIRLNNLRVQSVSVFESKKAQNDTTIGIRSGILYLLLGFLFSTGGIIFHIWFAGSATPLASGTEWVVLGTLICLMGILAVHDQRYLIKLVKDATLYSDLQMDRFGGVEYISEHSRRRHSG